MTVFWDVVPCSLVRRPDDGGSKYLWKVGQFVRGYTANIPEDSHLHANIMLNIVHCHDVSGTGSVQVFR
jgi:hypothetical protein